MKQQPEVTQLLNADQNNMESLSDVYEVLYNDIKNMAHYQLSRLPAGSTITPTVLAHEAYERIYNAIPSNYNDRQHFIRKLGKIMRNFLIDLVRSKHSLKHSKHLTESTVSDVVGDDNVSYNMFDLDKALSFISEIDPALTEILELKILFGFTFEESAKIIGISSRQTVRRWNQAKAILVSVLNNQ